MIALRKRGYAASALRLCITLLAMLTIVSSGPASAEEPPFNACSQCHPGMGDVPCAAMISVAIAQCCGQGGGWAWCVSNEWGTYVNCNNDIPPDCQCDDWGNNCDADFRVTD